MKRTLWLALSVGLLLAVALIPTACIRTRPTEGSAPTRQALGPTPTRKAAILIPTPTALPPSAPDAEQTPSEAAPTETPESVDVVVAPTAKATRASPATGGETAAGEIRYEVRWGDTLSQISRRFGCTAAAILARNPRITDRNRIFAGWVLIIPTTSGASTSQPPVARETGEYMVQPGDTLATIAHRFGTTIAALLQANPSITDMNRLRSGQVLVLPLGGDYTPPRTYVVQAGDTLATLARRFNTTVWAIRVRNNLSNSNLIYAGQVLIIP